MTVARFYLVSALGALAGTIILLIACSLFVGSPVPALIWLAASLIWFAVAIVKRGHPATVDFARKRIARRFLRLMMFS